MSATSSFTETAPGNVAFKYVAADNARAGGTEAFRVFQPRPRAAPVIRMTLPATLIVRSLLGAPDDAAGCPGAQSRVRTAPISREVWAMAPNTKRVFYVNALSHTVYLEILATRPDVQVDKLVNDSPEDEAERILSHAHAYQIGSSRQELAMKYQGYTPLLERCPNLVVLSTNGAGFDTVNLEDATKAGIAAVNQAGGNKEGVAEHVMAMMLSLSKRIMLTDHQMRRGVANITAATSWATTCSAAPSGSSDWAMSAPASPNCAAGCFRCGCWPSIRI
jgi:hypothetical protein